MRVSVYSRWKAIQGWLLSPACPLCACAIAPEQDFCVDCERALPRLTHCCSCCATPLGQIDADVMICGRCQQQPPAYAAIHAAFRYAPPIDRLIQGAKYAARLDWAALLGRQLAHHLRGRTPVFDALVPVPLHRTRLRERGYNQSLELARPLLKHLKIPLAHAVTRLHATPSQASLAAEERIKNVRDAFAINGNVKGLSVAVVDDVVTSGATVEAVARCLLRAGAKRVEILAVARA